MQSVSAPRTTNAGWMRAGGRFTTVKMPRVRRGVPRDRGGRPPPSVSPGLLHDFRAEAPVEDDLVAVRVHGDRVALRELTLEQPRREWIQHQPLDRALERPRPEGRVVALA